MWENVVPLRFVMMCIIGHYGNGMLDADGDDGGDHLPGRYVVSWIYHQI